VARLSPEAFADAFTASSRTLWCIAAGVLGRRDLVEDVLQEGAMIALGKLDQFDPGTSFVAWMGRIVRYVALNQARHRQRRAASAAAPEALASVPARADDAAPPPTTPAGDLHPDQTEFDDRVLRALRALDETARSCLLLRTMLDMPYHDIALALDVPEGTAMSHVHRARRSLRETLRDHALAPPRPAAARAETGKARP
jgi:RNA polymerase sigma-70 factor (ECF subfamily)